MQIKKLNNANDKSKYIIGISAYYHDSSACLFKDGKLVFACEEEKFTGIKHDNSFPQKTLDYIFKTYKIDKTKIYAVCYYENPRLKYGRVIENIKKNWYKHPLYCLNSFLKITKNIKKLDKLLPKISNNVFYSTHHEAHMYYSIATSPFENPICLSIDGVGEYDTAVFGSLNKKVSYTPLGKYPHSLGLFYSAMTSFLGFKPNEGEYKVMGLAAYGNPEFFIGKIRKLVTFKSGKIECNMNYFIWNKSDKVMFGYELYEFLGVNPRIPTDEIEQIHKDLAAAIQLRYEEVLFEILKTINKIMPTYTNLTLAGGCAYNGSANGKIINKTNFEHLWIPPAPSDAGSCIGACIDFLYKNDLLNGKITRNPFLGPLYYNDSVYKLLKSKKYKQFYYEDKMLKYIAKQLQDGKVIGWFQGHCEFGSRALGNRSILANPTIKGMKDKINSVVKKREGFRPFAPMVTKDKQNIFFDINDDIPYMNQVVKVKNDYANILTEVTHIDGTARVQTVYKHTAVHSLLIEFEKLSGYPILLNTSFNVKDKTMVLTPKDAIDTFFDTEIDILIINNLIIYK
jgi:carbamoyltransferase